jgi:cytochrome c peroxidase
MVKMVFNNRKFGALLLLVLMTCGGCTKQADPKSEPMPEVKPKFSVPVGFAPIDYPLDNQYDTARVALGRDLFFDPILSLDSSVSCGSCHLFGQAFTNPNAVPLGFAGRRGKRNTPTLTNVAYNTSFFWDGGVPSLEQQVIAPIESEFEMNLPITEAINRLQTFKDYKARFMRVYGQAPDLYGLSRSIAAFERTLVSGNSPFDQYTYQGISTALNQDQLAGRGLFMSDSLNCTACHAGFNFTNQTFQNNGLALVYQDEGRQRVSVRVQDIAKFKVPTLRNLVYSAPYMHDGSINTLEAVIRHYETGGQPHPSRSRLLKPFSLSNQQRNQLVAFLESLSDPTFVTNTALYPR